MRLELSNKNKNTPTVWPRLAPKTQMLYGAKTRAGHHFLMWKSNPISKGTQNKQLSRGFDTSYACHGFTVGSHLLKGGPFTPYGNGIDIILADEFHAIIAEELAVNDVIAWRDEEGDISHTAKISELYINKNNQLSDQTRLITKNGAFVLNKNMRLATLNLKYGNQIEFYREGRYELRSFVSP